MLNLSNTQFVILLGLGVGGAFYLKKKIAENVDLVNPASQDNVVNGMVNGVVDALDDGSSNGSASLGTWIYDLFHKEYDPNA